jgi:hypothetical protein
MFSGGGRKKKGKKRGRAGGGNIFKEMNKQYEKDAKKK